MARLLHGVLAAGFLFYAFIGTNPLGSASLVQRVEGNPLDRLLVLGLAMLALVVLAFHRQAIAALLTRGAVLWIVAGAAVLSVLWSDHPDLTLRRAILLACLTLVAAGVAAGVRDLRAFHTGLCWALAGVVVLNLAVVLAMPGIGMSEIGAKGIYTHKNVAGAVAMTAVLATATWMGGSRGSAGRTLAGFAMLALALAFLLLTRSKTSIGLSAMALACLAMAVLAARGGPQVALAALFLGLCGAIAGVIFLGAHDFDLMRIVALATGDASFTGRDDLWAFALRAAQERPWLGHGYGAFWDVGPGADPLLRFEPGSWLGDVEPGIINQAHNGYLELWLQLGLPVTLLAVAAIVALAATGAWCLAFSVGLPGTRAALCFMTVMPVLYLLHNFTEASLFMRGILLCNVMLPILFLLARAPDLVRPYRAPVYVRMLEAGAR